MKTLLRIDSSIRLTNSHTRELTNYFEEAWLRKNPDGNVIRRCLMKNPVPHLTQEVFDTFQNSDESLNADSLSDALVDEIKRADYLLIGSPLYNLGLPSSLKAYFDHIVRSGITFEIENDVYKGLLGEKRAILITARASYSSPENHDDFQKGYLEQILAFIGIKHIETVSVEGVEDTDSNLTQILAYAKEKIDLMFEPSNELSWLGEFTNKDRQEITQLRTAQAKAIISGDATAYASLCTEDIQLLIPAKDLVSGQDAFLKIERALFKNAKFDTFRKMPVCIQRSGDLAVEVGRLEVTMKNKGYSSGVFSSRQKYTHIFRRTNNGWRISLLMSNPSE
ncbi:MAG: NAD(P)H-dependent oxidoreductase [Gammaproteobacteria bacterium]|nr:NAD(P)H-dependent oxidoreductase [Gammaproteobacteria bacterium]MCF6259370.1 NAD(P)H-dependent oxidoreductase [Gammaproteobacteria bacterium]